MTAAIIGLLCWLVPTVAAAQIPKVAETHRARLLREVQFYWGREQPPGLFFGQVHQESTWNPNAKSPHAEGLTQFTPATAEWIQGLYAADLKPLCHPACPYDPAWALRAMVLYDKRLYDAAVFSVPGDDRYAFMLAGYNGGSGWWARERAACASRPGCDPQRWFKNVDEVCLRSPASCAENRHYPVVILMKWRPLYTAWLGAAAVEVPVVRPPIVPPPMPPRPSWWCRWLTIGC